MAAARVIKVEPTYCVGLWNNVVIAIIQGDMDVAGVRALGESYDKLFASYPKGVVGITVLRSSLKVGAREANAEAQRVMARLRGVILHIAIVIENQGFVAQLMRSVIRTLNSVGRTTRLSIAVNIDEALRVIIPYVGQASRHPLPQLEDELRQAVATLSAALQPCDVARG